MSQTIWDTSDPLVGGHITSEKKTDSQLFNNILLYHCVDDDIYVVCVDEIVII